MQMKSTKEILSKKEFAELEQIIGQEGLSHDTSDNAKQIKVQTTVIGINSSESDHEFPNSTVDHRDVELDKNYKREEEEEKKLKDTSSSQILGQQNEKKRENLTQKGAGVSFIQRQHELNRLEMNQYRTQKEYMMKVMYQVPLNDLYQVIASCNYSEYSLFCPVLIKIIDPQILGFNQGKRYLLQVWTNKGDLVFERPMNKPVQNWNISQDTFLFQEETNSPVVFLLRLFIDKPAYLFKFSFPQSVTQGSMYSFFDLSTQKFNISKETEHDVDANLEANESSAPLREATQQYPEQTLPDLKGEKFEETLELRFKNLNQRRVAPHEMSSQSQNKKKESVSDIFSDQIINSDPDKMIDYREGFILLAYRDKLIYLDVSAHNFEVYPTPRTGDELQKGPKVVSQDITLSLEHVQVLNLQKKFKIVCIQDIGEKVSAIVIEDILSRDIRLLKIQYCNRADTGGRHLKLVQLGALVTRSEQEKSPMLKFRGICKVEDQTGVSYHVSLVLRQSGRIEIYSDFMLVDEFMDPSLQCVDIDTDFKQFYLKFAKNSDLVTRQTAFADLVFELRDVQHNWRNYIGVSTARVVSNLEKWKIVVHKRCSRYMKLYSQVLNYSLYMLVSHRNMISVFSMKHHEEPTGRWIHTIEFSEGHIREMFIDKRTKKEREEIVARQSTFKSTNVQERLKNLDFNISAYKNYYIICLIGTHHLKFAELTSDGDLIKLNLKLNPPGRIIEFKDSKSNNCGILVLADQGPSRKDFERTLGCKIFTFPMAAIGQDAGALQLYSLKMLQFHPLLSASESECINYDSQFRMVRTRLSIFLKDDLLSQNSSEAESDPIQLAAIGKEGKNCLAFFCYSTSNSCARMFPLVKEKFANTKQTKRIYLLSNKENTKVIKDDGDHSGLLSAYFINVDDEDEDAQSFIKITEKKIQLFDDDLEQKTTFEGIKITEAKQLHHKILYTISNSINKPITIRNEDQDGQVQPQPNCRMSSSGFYAYNLQSLFQGKVEKYKIAPAIGGFCDIIDNSLFSDRLSFIQDYDSISVIPLPHLNLLSCVGMCSKHEYIIWREKNGFFTALDKNSNLFTWSIATGKLLYVEEQTQDASEKNVAEYGVYHADDGDITYTRNFYNFHDHSISLLKSKQPVTHESIQRAQNLVNVNVRYLARKLEKQFDLNRKGLVNCDKSIQLLDKSLLQPGNRDTSIEIINSDQQADLYHFKVMQLRTHEDTKGASQCSVRFNFIFKIIRKSLKSSINKCDWDIDSCPVQRLYLSKDTTKMMEVINNTIATVYTRYNIDSLGKPMPINTIKEAEMDSGQQVKWKIDFRIKRFPKSLAEHTSVPYLFSPNFTFQFDFNYAQNQFFIKTTSTQEVYLKIPTDLINTILNQTRSLEVIPVICSRIKWEDERVLRIVNQSNIDCLFELCSTDPTDMDLSARYLKLISVSKIDNLFINKSRLDSPHLLCEPFTLKASDVLERLMRINQNYKTSLQHALNTKNANFHLLEMINKIDYGQSWGDYNSSFDIEQSFTLLDWRIMEQMIKDVHFDLQNISNQRKMQICFNILPGGKSVLHKLALGSSTRTNSKQLEEGQRVADHIKSCFVTQELFEVASLQTHNYIIYDDENGVSLEIPILQDMYSFTPLDICLGVKETTDSKNNIFYDLNTTEWHSLENFMMAEAIFDKIKNYSFMHSSHQIKDAVTMATKVSLPTIKKYLESRLIKPEHSFLSATQRAIKSNQLNENPSMGEFCFRPTQIWAPENQTKKALFDDSGPLQPMNLRFLDLPFIYRSTPAGFNFIQALSQCEDLEIFSLKSVQLIIDFQAKKWDRVNFLCLGIPIVLQLCVFWYWSSIILPNLQEGQDDFRRQEVGCKVLLLITVFYLLVIEASTIYTLKLEYLNRMTNYIQILSPILIIVNIFREKKEEASFWTIQTWSALVIWWRFLLFLRSVTAFSWLIRMIIECLKDMLTFLLVLFFSIIAFADAFQSIEKILVLEETIEATSVSQDADLYDKYVKRYFKAWQKSFLMALGEFDENLQFYREGDWMIFFICCIFNIILLLNLLISIISETFGRISATSIQTGYKEKAIQMRFVQDSIFGLRQFEPNSTELLFIAKVIKSEEMHHEENDTDRFDELTENMQDMEERLTSFIEDKVYALALMFSQRVNNDTENMSPADKINSGLVNEAKELLGQKNESSRRPKKEERPLTLKSSLLSKLAEQIAFGQKPKTQVQRQLSQAPAKKFTDDLMKKILKQK